MSTITRERLEQLANFRGAPVTRQEEQELAHIALASREAVPSPELLCQFVMQNYANYQGAWLCGKSSEILSFLLLMAGHECEKVACTINGVGHLYVRCGDLILDPSIAQFGDYPQISRGEHPCVAIGYVENSTEPQKYRNAICDGEITAAIKEKLKVNMSRQWPEPKEGEPRLHVKEDGTSLGIPDGWKLVPVNAFPSQWAAGQKAFNSARINKVDAVYKAMIAAAPPQEVKPCT